MPPRNAMCFTLPQRGRKRAATGTQVCRTTASAGAHYAHTRRHRGTSAMNWCIPRPRFQEPSASVQACKGAASIGAEVSRMHETTVIKAPDHPGGCVREAPRHADDGRTHSIARLKRVSDGRRKHCNSRPKSLPLRIYCAILCRVGFNTMLETQRSKLNGREEESR